MVERLSSSTREPEVAVPVLEKYFSGVRMSTPRSGFGSALTSADEDGLTQLD
jgi:hypothetical protein